MASTRSPPLGTPPAAAAPSPPRDGALLEVGQLGRAHGVRGEMKVRLHWEGSEALEQVSRVLLRHPRGDEAWFTIEKARRAQKAVLLALDGVGSREVAERWRGAAVCVERAELPPLEPGEVYLCDLVGARVVGPDGPLGRVVEIVSNPASDGLRIALDAGGFAEQVLADAWVEDVDAEGGLVTLASLDGLVR